jgi:hypothetical protein
MESSLLHRRPLLRQRRGWSCRDDLHEGCAGRLMIEVGLRPSAIGLGRDLITPISGCISAAAAAPPTPLLFFSPSFRPLRAHLPSACSLSLALTSHRPQASSKLCFDWLSPDRCSTHPRCPLLLQMHAMQTVTRRSVHHLVSCVWSGQSRHLQETTRCLLRPSKYGRDCFSILLVSLSLKQASLVNLFCAAKELFR